MMGIELKNVRLMTQEQHDVEVLKDQAEHYRQVALGQEQDILRLQRKIKRMRKERKALVSDIEGYVQVANEYAVENDSLVRQLEKATRTVNECRKDEANPDAKMVKKSDIDQMAKDMADSLRDPESKVSKALNKALGDMTFANRNAPGVIPVEHGDSNIPAKPFLNPSKLATGGYVGPECRKVGEFPSHVSKEYVIPHHGPGLSEAEDAMRCDTYVPGKGGIAGTGRRPAGMVGKDEPMINLGRLKMPPFNLIPEHPADSKADSINPSHYKRGGLEAIDVIRAATTDLTGEEAYCIGNAIKYLFRWKHKGGKTDLSKARWHINRMLGDA